MYFIYIAFYPKSNSGIAGWVRNTTHYNRCHLANLNARCLMKVVIAVDDMQNYLLNQREQLLTNVHMMCNKFAVDKS